MARGDTMFNLRFRMASDIHARIKEAAAANNRSMNSEIEHRLVASFETSRAVVPALQKLIDDYVDAEVATRLQRVAASIGGRGDA